MNTIINQTVRNEAGRAGLNYCGKKFEGSGSEVVNLYKCNQRQFSTADSWNIQKNKKHISIGSDAGKYLI